ncbi:N-formylglutamate amidohydrolase [Hellea balneolensis]|uniref:N-formylglutamate amidohydrolase n=1 Tax=Hellea balneolensis TaxID=287478 RepID=UPI0003FED127|nr:N-formylglutamate amidohydrolase [Hellea balneolensis]
MTPDMTSAYHKINSTKETPLFVFGDHASKHIPAELNDLGLTGNDLTRHIAWDIGTEIIVRELCAHFGCGGQLAGVSRLVIDLNRSLDMPGLIPVVSDGTLIPGNENLTDTQRRDRVERFYDPYHEALGRSLEAMSDPLVLSVHSFTAKPDLGDYRLLDIGLLVKHDEDSAEQLREMFMRLGRNFTIGMNEPYSAHDLNHTIDAHVAPRGLRHLAIEIRQDHIDTEDKAIDIAKVLAGRLEPLFNRNRIDIISP